MTSQQVWKHKIFPRLKQVGIIIGGLLLLYQVILGIRGLLLNPTSFNFSAILAAWVLIVISLVQQMIAWKIIMDGIGVKIPVLAVFKNYFVSFLPRYIPGTVWGYLTRGQWLAEDYQVGMGLSNLGSLFEVGIGILANLLIIGIYLIFQLPAERQFLASAGLIILAILSWWIVTRMLTWRKIRSIFGLTDPGNFKQISVQHWLASLVIICLNLMLYGAALFLTSRGTGAAVPAFSVSTLFHFSAIFCVAYLIGFLVFFVPSGLGLREMGISFLLTQQFGIDYQVSSAIAILFRLIVMGSEITWLLIGILLPRRKSVLKPPAEKDSGSAGGTLQDN